MNATHRSATLGVGSDQKSRVSPPTAISLMNTQEAADYLNMSKRTLDAWRVRGGGPKFVKIGRLARYMQSALDDFIAAGERNNTSESV